MYSRKMVPVRLRDNRIYKMLLQIKKSFKSINFGLVISLYSRDSTTTKIVFSSPSDV